MQCYSSDISRLDAAATRTGESLIILGLKMGSGSSALSRSIIPLSGLVPDAKGNPLNDTYSELWRATNPRS
jgi:protocatechuate 3,4-dioxygenase beta subunit